jgi:chemotaxis protein MotB
MRTVKVSGMFFVCVCVVMFITGCMQENDLRIQNATQRKRIESLESNVQAAKLQIGQLERQLQAAQSLGAAETESLKQKIAALEDDLAKKRALITSMQQQLINGGGALPAELNTMLEDFARTSDIVSYDPNRGVVKFKSDLLFEAGSDIVVPAARQAVEALCKIMNTEQGQKFDIIIAGHTDDLRIGKPETREKHPTNWHLSAHRAISVLNVMVTNSVAPERLSVRGFGEFRPLESNKADKKGNPVNRRVELYIVPKGV